MELSARFLVLILIALIVFVALLIGIINPINNNVKDTGSLADRTAACSKWNIDGCKDSKLTNSIMEKIGCSNADNCRKICRRSGFC